MSASPRPLQPNEVAAFIRDAHAGEFDPLQNARQWIERFCWQSDDPLAATHVAGCVITYYDSEYDAGQVEELLVDRVSAARLAELVDGAEPTEEEKTQYTQESWGHAVDCGLYSYAAVYRLVAPAGHPEQRSVFFFAVAPNHCFAREEYYGPFPNVQAMYDHAETLSPDGWWIEQPFPEQVECEDLNITTSMQEFADYWGEGPNR